MSKGIAIEMRAWHYGNGKLMLAPAAPFTNQFEVDPQTRLGKWLTEQLREVER